MGWVSLFSVAIQLMVLAPIGEELLFRGLIFRALWERLPLGVSAVMSGALFGAVHGDLVVFPVIALGGIVGALLYARSRNLWAAMALHASTNAFSVVDMAMDLARHH